MKSKKGFTLIELLAIIVILAIIAVITVPIILNIIEDSQKGAAKDSAYGFKDSINKYYVSELAKDPHFHLEDGTYTVSEVNGSAVLTGEEAYTISLSGTVPTSGTITIENNDIIGGNVQIGDYCIDLSNMEITKGECGDTPIVNATPEECFEYEDNGDNTVTITGYLCHRDSEKPIVDVIIPSKIEGKNVTIIGEYAFSKILYDPSYVPTSNINNKAVVKPLIYSKTDNNYVSINSIEDQFPYINSIIIPDTVTEIDDYAFENNELTSVSIPNSITRIGRSAFSNNQLTSITIPNNLTELESYVFSDNQITSIIIPSNITTIGDGAFENNQLTSLDIPNNVTSIGRIAFESNEIENLTLPNSITIIEDYTFSLNQLTNVEIPNSVTEIGISAFENNNLTSITLSNNLTTIGNSAFARNKLTSVILPNSLTRIDGRAFTSNELTRVVIGNKVTNMGGYVFYENPNVTISVKGISSKPSSWNANWNPDNYPVNWNYAG